MDAKVKFSPWKRRAKTKKSSGIAMDAATDEKSVQTMPSSTFPPKMISRRFDPLPPGAMAQSRNPTASLSWSPNLRAGGEATSPHRRAGRGRRAAGRCCRRRRVV
jgi:hypothetical protein